jgi:quercetin dioxygenase-like cupin family protein
VPITTAANENLEPAWEAVAPGISCKIPATDAEGHRVSMLVRLAPGADYPPHVHAGLEELHLLAGELWIDDRKLSPGDYNRAEPGNSAEVAASRRVANAAADCRARRLTPTR